MACHAYQHNRLDPRYDGRIHTVREWGTGRHDVCKVCGEELLIRYPSGEVECHQRTEVEEYWDVAWEGWRKQSRSSEKLD